MWLRELKRSLVIAGTLALGIGACAGESDPMVSDARVFVEAAEARLLDLWRTAGRASWVQSNFITEDTNGMAAAANADVMAATTELASAAARLNELVLPEDLDRKLLRLKTSLSAVAPSDPALQQELAEIMTEMESIYGQGEFCPDREDGCLDLPTMERMFAEVRETDELLAIWKGWREVSPQIQPLYERFVELSNAGAQELSFADLGDMWRSGYDMPPAAFTAELERLWEQVRPLYESLHCHVRAELGDQYGTAGRATRRADSGSFARQHVEPVLGQYLRCGRSLEQRSRLRPHAAAGAAGRRRDRDGALRRALFQLTGFRAAAGDVLGSVALHQARRPGGGVSCECVESRLRIRHPDQDVYWGERRRLRHDSSRTRAQLLSARIQSSGICCIGTVPTTGFTRASAIRLPCRSRPSIWSRSAC